MDPSILGAASVTEAIFLSASIPDPKRDEQAARTAEPVAIAAAVSALLHVTLGRRLLVWGGHPAITPMVWAVAEGLGADYGAWVTLYQSEHFEDEFPEDNERFHNVVYTPDIGHDRARSLKLMRTRMFSDVRFAAAVFIGGMRGIVDEFEMLSRLQPSVRLVPVVSTGGATLAVAERLPPLPDDLRSDLDYVALFHRNLSVDVREARYRRPSDQPTTVEARLWTNDDSPADPQ